MDLNAIHALRVHEVFQALETSPQGISLEAAQERLSLYGANALEEPRAAPPWRRFIGHTAHPMALTLWAGAALSLFLQEFTLGVVIILLVVVNAVFSFWREYRAEQAMRALRERLPAYARVMRADEEQQIPAGEVVPGDLLVLAEGDNIPADARVIEEYGLRTNNAALTGEAVPARKTADASLREDISELERANLVFAGTSVVSGTGRAVVYATGMSTQFGRIAHLTQSVKEEPSPLQRELLGLTRRIALAAAILGGLVFIVVLTESWQDQGMAGLLRAVVYTLGVVVAVVPEGLPATITLSLAMAATRLAGRSVLVKKLSVIETLGVVSLICTDKSGTLTENQMTVREVWAGRQRFTLSGVGYEPAGEYRPPPGETPAEGDLMMLLTAAELCNNSRLIVPTAENPLWSGLGDQTEVALRVAARKGQVDVAALTGLFPRIHELPFDARRKRMSTIHRDLGGQVVFVKGAPREVLQLCATILLHGETCPLDEALRAEILAANDDYARGALRVLALARRDLPPRSGSYSVEGVERDLTFLGLMAMMDPPRPEVEQAVKTLHAAGINLVMITGDYGLTAVSLARRVGMIAGAEPLILTGAELDELDDDELDDLLERKEIVFARMAPEHKLRLVAAYQQRGEVVAVTGDGVNDAPALRKADVGVVMGLVGTDVAKEAADVILTTDNFSTITAAIEEGRTVFANLRKFITYIFSSNVPEVAPFLFTGLFNLPLALNAKQVLAIDLGTDLLPALALGTEKPEPDVMLHPPRSRRQPLIDRGLLARSLFWLGPIETVLCYLGFFAVYYFEGAIGIPDLALERLGALPALLRAAPGGTHLLAATVFHAGVVLAQAGNAFACRSENNRGRALGWASNRALLGAVAIEVGLILVMIYVPAINGFFDHLPLPGAYWALLAVYPLVLYGLEWIRKGFSRRSATNGNGHDKSARINGHPVLQANQTGRGQP